MELMDRTGTFKGKVLDKGVSKTKNGYPQYVLRLAAMAYYDETEAEWVDWQDTEQGITAYLCLFGKDGTATFQYDAVQKVTGWDGKSFVELADLDIPEIIQFTVKENEYDGNATMQVSSINTEDAVPGGVIRTLDKSELKELDAMFAKGLQRAKKSITPAKKKETPSIPPKRSSKATSSDKAETPLREISTKIEAWQAAVEANKNGVNFDDEQLSELWITTINDIAGQDIDEEYISAEAWGEIKIEMVSALGE